MAIEKTLAVIGMIIATVNIADSSVSKPKTWDDLAELEQEPHSLLAMIALRIVLSLDEHGTSTLVGNLGCLQIVSIKVGSNNLR